MRKQHLENDWTTDDHLLNEYGAEDSVVTT